MSKWSRCYTTPEEYIEVLQPHIPHKVILATTNRVNLQRDTDKFVDIYCKIENRRICEATSEFPISDSLFYQYHPYASMQEAISTAIYHAFASQGSFMISKVVQASMSVKDAEQMRFLILIAASVDFGPYYPSTAAQDYVEYCVPVLVRLITAPSKNNLKLQAVFEIPHLVDESYQYDIRETKAVTMLHFPLIMNGSRITVPFAHYDRTMDAFENWLYEAVCSEMAFQINTECEERIAERKARAAEDITVKG